MSGKYAKKKNNPVPVIILIILLVAAAAAVVILQTRDGGEANSPSGTEPVSTTESTATEQTVDATEKPTELPMPDDIDLGSGLVITDVGAYTGAFVEDGTDEQVEDVLMIEVYNYGIDPIQYAEISLGDAEFVLTTLPVGETMRMLEKDRMAFDENAEYTQAAAQNVARFQKPMSLCQDKIQIQPLDGAMNIINVSGADITGEVTVYYKNTVDGVLHGGITYRVRIMEGMKAGEVRQIVANHYSESGSRVMFVTCG